MIHSIHLLSVFPKRFVCHADTLRAAQILARLLAERFPGMSFGYDEGPDCRGGECHPSIRDSALSFEVQQLVAAELVLEAGTNPRGLPKWCVFQHRDGGVCAYRDHDLEVIQRCRRDPDVSQERTIYTPYPTTGEILDCFRTEADLID